MIVHFGLCFQEGALPRWNSPVQREVQWAPRQLLLHLEHCLGLTIPDDDVDFLRTEQYRQALKYYLANIDANAFFAATFEADALATANALLEMRDELVGGGWDFSVQPDLPERLRVLAQLETWLQNPEMALNLLPGLADRLVALLGYAAQTARILTCIHLADERWMYPPAWQRLLDAWKSEGLIIHEATVRGPSKNNDLGTWQCRLKQNDSSPTTPPLLKGDGSLLIVKAYRETHLAAWLAQLFRINPALQPAVLLPQANRTLDNSLLAEGLPSLGVPSASIARPALQILKLAPIFLWDPIDPHKVMEFVSLSLKPLEDGLAQRIANFLADTPGLFSDRWFAMINQYLEEELPEKALRNSRIRVDDVKEEYQFWFRRTREDSQSGRVAKQDVRRIYAHLHHWAIGLHREESTPSLMTLASQAEKMTALLDALPEDSLSYLELERAIRTIYQPAPVVYQAAEAGRLDTVHQTGAFNGPVKQIVWWDFVHREPDYFFSKWYPEERSFFEANAILIEEPALQNQRVLQQRKRPVFWAEEHLILCVPSYSDGTAVEPHPLYGDLQATFGEDLDAITAHLDMGFAADAWEANFILPSFHFLDTKPLDMPRPFIHVKDALRRRTAETPTSLDQLLYFPHQWFFQYQARLRPSSILSIVPDNRLLGNLAHRLLEQLLRQDPAQFDKRRVYEWVAQEMPQLLRKEGATLLMYGQEPERVAFTRRVQFAAWSLIDLIRANGWQVIATELQLEGEWLDLNLKGRADLVMQRGKELVIIDLKYRGEQRYSNLLTSMEDTQLALYTKLMDTEEPAHTAYFIIEKGKMLARNNAAFKDIQALAPDQDHKAVYRELWQKIATTMQWRQQQLSAGRLEIRCEETTDDLEDAYLDMLHEVLEMKRGNAPFDNYDVLIGLVR